MAAADSTGQVVPRVERFEPSAERWSPRRWTAELGPALVVALRTALGSPANDRPAHRHGVVWKGRFRPSGEAAGLSDFAAFRGPERPALARFSNMYRRPGAHDIQGMATKLVLPDDEVTDLVAMSLEVFPVRRSRHFLALLETRQKRPVRSILAIAAMLASRRLSARALVLAIATALRSRDIRHTTFHGVHTFRLVRSPGPGLPPERRVVRYRWVPRGAGEPGTAAGSPDGDQVRFDLELVLGHPGWPRVFDPTWRWPRRAPTVRAGQLILDEVIQPEPRDLAFNPAVLAPGIEPGDDDVFPDRAGAYAVAQAARTGPGDADATEEPGGQPPPV